MPLAENPWNKPPACGDLNDAALRLRGAVSGDAGAIESLLVFHRPDIQRFAYRLCAVPEDAEEVVQHTLYVLSSQLGTFRKLARLTSWLFAVVKHECLKRLRGRRPSVPIDDTTLWTDDSPSVRLMRTQLIAAVAQGVARLAPELRTVLLCREFEGMSAAQTAALLGLSVAAVKSRLHRARAALREDLEPLARQWDLV